MYLKLITNLCLPELLDTTNNGLQTLGVSTTFLMQPHQSNSDTALVTKAALDKAELWFANTLGPGIVT